MKERRHDAILDIIANNDIETQEDLIAKLNEMGFVATQATISRDIKQLKLFKVTGREGRYKYVAPVDKNEPVEHVYATAFATSVKSVETAASIVVIKTYPGLAQAVAASIDSLNETGIVGCVAGDDTIFAATISEKAAYDACMDMKKILRGEK